MNRKMRYYRTAALLGPQDQHAVAAVRRRRIKVPWQLVVALLLAAGLGLWVAMSATWYVDWPDLTVEGVTSAEVAYEIKVKADLLGWHRFSLKPEEAQAVLVEALPEYREIRVRCGVFPAKCTIVVTQRTPIVTWVTATRSYWVDDTWTFYRVMGDRPDLPVIKGPLPARAGADDASASQDGVTGTRADGSSTGGSYTASAVYEGVKALATLGIPAEQLDFVPQRGLVWTDPDGRRVAFGAGPYMAPRLRVYEAVIEHCEANGIFPLVVDARFPGGATYSTELTW